jgi:RNase adaptor protein for sRNA GlmZ degradation
MTSNEVNVVIDVRNIKTLITLKMLIHRLNENNKKKIVAFV